MSAQHKIANELINKMITAVELDHENNRHARPALNRLMLANEVYS